MSTSSASTSSTSKSSAKKNEYKYIIHITKTSEGYKLLPL